MRLEARARGGGGGGGNSPSVHAFLSSQEMEVYMQPERALQLSEVQRFWSLHELEMSVKTQPCAEAGSQLSLVHKELSSVISQLNKRYY